MKTLKITETSTMYDHMFKIHGPNVFLVNKRYKENLVGNSPEFNRATDAHGFADWNRCISLHASINTFLENEDPRKFKMGTLLISLSLNLS